ncbi:unnamed protein product, partial [Iphiclides podalirius]
MIVQEPIQVIVWDCLNNYEYDNAIFLAERLHAEVASEETAFLLGTCYYRAGRINEAHHLLQNISPTLPQSRFLLAKCAIELKSYKEAEIVLGSNLDIVASEFGHEYAVAEETDKALASFRTAVSIDSRNYVAWFGIATVYARQERWKASEVHIRRALAIHPHSGVLRCQLGLAQAALGKMDRALATLERAVTLDTENPLCRFHRASVLLRAGRPRDALEDLHHLKDIAPRESLVYYLLGKVHNKLGNSHLALMHFSWATDLDPKGTGGHIKDGFDPSKQEDPPERAT